jgi:undecaprenyl pyrophosphate phosphatase UppP
VIFNKTSWLISIYLIIEKHRAMTAPYLLLIVMLIGAILLKLNGNFSWSVWTSTTIAICLSGLIMSWEVYESTNAPHPDDLKTVEIIVIGLFFILAVFPIIGIVGNTIWNYNQKREN